MGSLIDSAAGLLSRRLVVTTWIPLFVLLTALTLLTAAGIGWSAVASAWDGIPVNLQVLAGLACLALTTLLAQLLNAVRPHLIRLYEGYWPERIAQRYREGHRQIHGRLAGSDPWPAEYPRASRRVLPTRLGNILRAAEEHPRLQYGIPAVVFWPRLYGVLPESFRVMFAGVAADLELMITVSALGVVLGAAGSVVAAMLLPWWAAPLVLLTGAAVFWLGYLAAVRAALPYADQVRAAFDVHRWKLLQDIGLRLPTSYEEERAQWAQLAKLWAGAGPDSDRAVLLRYPFEQPPFDPALSAGLLPAAAPPATADIPAAAVPSPVLPPRPPVEPAPAPAPPEPRPHARLKVDLSLLLVAVLGVTVGATVTRAVRAEEPAVARRALPAFHQLTDTDLKGAADDLIGHYTTTPIKSGAELDTGALGPELPKGVFSGRSLITLACAPGSSAIVRDGDTATLRWTLGRSASVESLSGVLLLKWLPGDHAVFAALSSDIGRLPTTAPVQLARE